VRLAGAADERELPMNGDPVIPSRLREEPIFDDLPAAEDESDRIPLPQDMSTALLVGIFTLMMLYTLYFTREIVMPVLFAGLLNLLLQPVMRLFGKAYIPRFVSAAFLILILFGSFTLLFSSLSGPASAWIAKLPQTLPRIEERLSVLKKPLDRLAQTEQELSKLAAPRQNNAMAVVVQGSGLGNILFSSTRDFLTGLISTVIVLYFLLIAGDLFLRKIVEVLPRFRDKKRAVSISQEIEGSISAYLVTISIMNLLVGFAVGVAAYLSGLGDPLLWGAVGFLLNYIPILGPLVGVVVFFLGGMLVFDTLWQAVLIAGIYLGIHILEGEVITPMLVARRLTLNPVLVIISLLFWYWMWGIPGAIMSFPLLASIKIICDHVRPLMALGHFLSG
jgi:predicted PurR-regulated permease PerM